MGVNKTLERRDPTAERIVLTVDLINEGLRQLDPKFEIDDEEGDDAVFEFLVALRMAYASHGATEPVFRPDTDDWAERLEGAIRSGEKWLDVARAWGRNDAVLPAAIRDELGEALATVRVGDQSGYRYNAATARFEWQVVDPVASAEALIALALLPLFDARDDRYRSALGRCEYRNCRRYFLLIGKKNSGQRSCPGTGHGGSERQNRVRDKKKRR